MTDVTLEPRSWHDEPIVHLNADEGPASINQESLWLRHPDIACDPAFTISSAIELPGAVDQGAMQAACDVMAERHPALRTSFALTEHGYRQSTQGRRPIPVEHSVLKDEGRLDEAANEFCRRPFDLWSGPLVRVQAMQASGTTTVQVAFHHAVTDWVSTQTFFGELATVYRALQDGDQPDLSPLPVDYIDFATWERDLLGRGAWRDDLEHWRSRMSNPGALLWDRDGADRRGHVDFSAYRVHFAVDEELAVAVSHFARAHRITMFMTVLGIYQVLLHSLTGRDDVTVGISASARARPDIDSMIGYFLNIVPLRADLSRDPTIKELFQRVRSTTAEDMQHSTMATGALYDELFPGQCPWRDLWVQTRLVFLPSHEAIAASAARPKADVQTGGTGFDLTLAVWAAGGTMFGRFDFRRAVFRGAEVEAMAQAFTAAARAVVRMGDARLSEVCAAIGDEVRAVRSASN